MKISAQCLHAAAHMVDSGADYKVGMSVLGAEMQWVTIEEAREIVDTLDIVVTCAEQEQRKWELQMKGSGR